MKRRLIVAGPVAKALSNLKAYKKTQSHGKSCQHYDYVLKSRAEEKKAKDDQEVLQLRYQEMEKSSKANLSCLNSELNAESTDAKHATSC